MLLGKEFSKESVWQLLEEVYQHVKIKCMKSHKSDKQSRKDEFWKFLKVVYNKSETGSDFIRTVITHIRRLWQSSGFIITKICFDRFPLNQMPYFLTTRALHSFPHLLVEWKWNKVIQLFVFPIGNLNVIIGVFWGIYHRSTIIKANLVWRIRTFLEVILFVPCSDNAPILKPIHVLPIGDNALDACPYWESWWIKGNVSA